MRIFFVSLICIFSLIHTHALASKAKIVKAPSDRTCVETDGKLSCSPKKTKHRAQNMAGQQVSKSDQAGSAADKGMEESKAPEKAVDAPEPN